MTKESKIVFEQAISYPLSFAQQRLWFLDQLMPGSSFYNLPLAIRINVPVNASALERSLNECIRRHEILRTTFALVNHEPRQVIVPTLKLKLKVIDLTRTPRAEREAEALRLATEEALQPFDLVQGPLLRAVLLRLSLRENVLLVSMHHIISDDWSLGILWKELAVIYSATVASRPHNLAALRIQYLDFAVWQREWLRGEVLEEQLSYWKRQLAGLPILELPTDHARPVASNFRGAFHPVMVPGSVARAAEALARSRGVTLFMVTLAAFQVLLSRYSGQTDVAVGAPIANRGRGELEGLIGFFVNTLVLRSDLGGDPSFGELLTRVKEVCLGAYGHQDLPFEKLVEELQPARDLSRNPLVQVTFQLQQAPFQSPEEKSLGTPALDVQRGTAIFDLAFRLWDTGEGLKGGIEYSTELFTPETIKRLSEHYLRLLRSAVADPTLRLSELPLLSEEESRRLLVEWNQTKVEYPREATVHELFAAQARRTPEAEAVRDEGSVVSYAELDQWSDRLAEQLRSAGVKRESIVGVLMGRSVAMVAALLGVLKAGGGYLPFDTSYPTTRLKMMAENARVRLVLTQSAMEEQAHELGPDVICIGKSWQEAIDDGFKYNQLAATTGNGRLAKTLRVSNRSPGRAAKAAPSGGIGVAVKSMTGDLTGIKANNGTLVAGVSSQNVAYAMYTSGSTGQPKGVVISHGALCNHMIWMHRSFPLNESDRVLQKTPISFDASVWEFYAPLMAGACLVMAPAEPFLDASVIVDQIVKHKITTIQLVPTLLKLCLDEPRFRKCRSLRRVFCGGEPLTNDLVRTFKQTGLRAGLYNLYGPTEATIDVTHDQCDDDPSQDSASLGRPIANTRVYVLDREMRAVPEGVPGEIYVGGDCLARGYVRAAGMTAERFLPDPFAEEAGQRMYRTGDLGRFVGGKLIYQGRVDRQVKVRGQRVELGEVEAAVRQLGGVRECAVEVVGEEARLVAYVVRDGDEGVVKEEEARAWREQLSGWLPGHMVPAGYMALGRLPLLPNGKVDRGGLRSGDWGLEVRGRRAERAEAETETEQRLLELWGEVLGAEEVGAEDGFFELGGHSLLATRLVGRVREEFGVEVGLRALFEAPTPRQFAVVLETMIIEELESISDDETRYLLSSQS